jgi:hypothetical protein
VSLAEGILQAMDPRTLTIYWQMQLPLGESLEQGFATFTRENKSYLLCVTNQSHLLLINAVDGSTLWKTEIEGMPSAPIQIITIKTETFALVVTDKKWILMEPYLQKVIVDHKISHTTSLSPLLVQIPGDFCLIMTYPSGLIESFDRKGNILWSVQLKGELWYDPSAIVKNGNLHLLLATSEKMIVWVDGLTGLVKATNTLPGFPRSPISLAREDLNYSLLVSQDTQKSVNSFFFSGSLEKDRLPRIKMPIPGNSFIGLGAIQTRYNECFYVMASDYKWMVINKAAKFLMRPYPVNLLSTVKPLSGFLTGRDMIFCEGAILINVHENGLLILGTPSQVGENKSLQSGLVNATDDYATDAQNYSGGRMKADLDYLPEPVVSLQKRWDIAPSDSFHDIITPTSFYLEKQKKWILLMSGKNGKISFLDERGEIWKQYSFHDELIYVQPILNVNADGSLELFVLSTKSLLKATIDPTLQKMKIIWKTDDLGSPGGSFNYISVNEKKMLLFVDSFSYLTSVDSDTSDINYRVKVDTVSFVTSKINSTPYLFCGSKEIKLLTGQEVYADQSSSSESTVLGLLGTTFLFQSNDLDMTCMDVQTREIRWRVRKLWCKAYCFGYHAPAVYRMDDQAFTYWADYKRIICIDAITGMIRWIYFSPDDYFHTKPSVAVVDGRCYVYAGSIRGNLYALDGMSGQPISSYPLQIPGKEEKTDRLKGLSSPVLLNGCLFITRVEVGVFRIGQLKPANQRYFSIFLTLGIKESIKKRFIFNRAILYWDLYYRFSERVKWKITEGNPIIFLTFLKKMKKLM